MTDIPVYSLNLPEYQVNQEPDHAALASKADKFLITQFMKQHVAVRCLSLGEHPGKSMEEMIEIIKALGHDRYDPARAGDRYENNEGKQIDFFAFDYVIDEKTEIFATFTWPFYHWGKEKTGTPQRIDLILFYDPSQLHQIEFTYAGRENEGPRSDGWVFQNPQNKPAALKGIVKIL